MANQLLVANIVRLRVVCYTSNQVGINTAHYKVSAVAGAGLTDQAAAVLMDGDLAPLYRAAINNNARYRGVSLQILRPLPVGAAAISTANDGAGVGPGDLMATQVSGIIGSRANQAGRANRGRVYIPFPSESDNTSAGAPNPAYLATLDPIGNYLFTTRILGVGPDQVTLQPCLWHRTSSTTTSILDYAVRSKWATQRRRGMYGRLNLPPF